METNTIGPLFAALLFLTPLALAQDDEDEWVGVEEEISGELEEIQEEIDGLREELEEARARMEDLTREIARFEKLRLRQKQRLEIIQQLKKAAARGDGELVEKLELQLEDLSERGDLGDRLEDLRLDLTELSRQAKEARDDGEEQHAAELLEVHGRFRKIVTEHERLLALWERYVTARKSGDEAAADKAGGEFEALREQVEVELALEETRSRLREHRHEIAEAREAGRESDVKLLDASVKDLEWIAMHQQKLLPLRQQLRSAFEKEDDLRSEELEGQLERLENALELSSELVDHRRTLVELREEGQDDEALEVEREIQEIEVELRGMRSATPGPAPKDHAKPEKG